jgi:alpha,alpha-trehalase
LNRWILLAALAWLPASAPATDPASAPGAASVDARAQLGRLLSEADTDHDRKITVGDAGARRFWLQDRKGTRLEVAGTYALSNLLQELKLAADERRSEIRADRVFERPATRVSRSIRERYWDGLTRQVDAAHLAQVLVDPKLPRREWRHLYVPYGDAAAFEHFTQAAREHPELKLKVWRLPPRIDGSIMREIRDRHGLLTLALRKGAHGLEGVPFVVPGGRFNEMYGWDSYFESLGLLADGRVELARAMVDNFVYEIENYGKILNANRTYYLNRSQPPFLTAMISAIYPRLKKGEESRRWLRRALQAAMKEYAGVWMNADRLTPTGLSRYFGDGHGIPPEVEPGHFDFILKPAARRHRLTLAELERRYNSGELKDPALDEFFAHDRAVRESGHDTTYRWRVNGRDRAADFVTVDLNSLLYRYELDLARLVRQEFGGELAAADGEAPVRADEWRARAARRKALMLRYLWDPERKLFFDYCYKDAVRSTYVSATAFYPLWAMDAADAESRILSDQDARAAAANLLASLEMAGGLASTAEASLRREGDPKHPRQWEFPNGWAPHQMIAWEGLRAYGLAGDSARLTYRWLYTIARNAADYNGTVPEKFDVVKRSHAVFAEYGNVGTQFSYITQEGFGWMNASFQVGLASLDPARRERLDDLVPPEWLALSSLRPDSGRSDSE